MCQYLSFGPNCLQGGLVECAKFTALVYLCALESSYCMDIVAATHNVMMFKKGSNCRDIIESF